MRRFWLAVNIALVVLTAAVFIPGAIAGAFFPDDSLTREVPEYDYYFEPGDLEIPWYIETDRGPEGFTPGLMHLPINLTVRYLVNTPDGLGVINWRINVYISSNSEFEETDLVNSYDYYAYGVYSGAYSSGITGVNLGNQPPGTYYIMVRVVDQTGAEAIVGNNTLTDTFQVRAPDLALQEWFVPENLGAEEIITVEATIRNIGDASLPITGGWYDELYAVYVDDLGEKTVRHLATSIAANVTDLTYEITFTGVDLRDFVRRREWGLAIFLDTGNVEGVPTGNGHIYEGDETNNSNVSQMPDIMFTLTITAPNGVTDPAAGVYLYPAYVPSAAVETPTLTQVNITQTPDAGYDFEFWTVPELVYDNGSFGLIHTQVFTPSLVVNMDWNKQIDAFYLKQNYTLTVNISGHGAVTPAGVNDYPRGSVVPLTAVPDPGYRFDRWTGDLWEITGNPASPEITIAMNWDWHITANFVPDGTFTIGGIVVNPEIYEGMTVTITGVYQGWASAYGTPPVTRSDWVIEDGDAAIYVTGSTLGLRYPGDVGKTITVTGIVRLNNGTPYLVVSGGR